MEKEIKDIQSLDKLDEMSEMRRQLEEMKAQLDRQTIVNDKMLSATMSGKMSWIRKMIVMEMISLPFIVLLFIFIKEFLHLSWWNYGFMLVMCVVDTFLDYRINIRSIRSNDYLRDNLLTTMRKLEQMKRQRRRQQYVMMPLLVVWLMWSGLEACSSLPDGINGIEDAMSLGGAVGMIVGGLCGLVAAVVIYLKMQKTNDDVISQIKDM